MKVLTLAMLSAVVITSTSITSSRAEEKAINLSLVADLDRKADSVTTFRFNLLYGKNTSVQVLDLGLVNHHRGLSRPPVGVSISPRRISRALSSRR
jgi:hypothetical protein